MFRRTIMLAFITVTRRMAGMVTVTMDSGRILMAGAAGATAAGEVVAGIEIEDDQGLG